MKHTTTALVITLALAFTSQSSFATSNDSVAAPGAVMNIMKKKVKRPISPNPTPKKGCEKMIIRPCEEV